MTRGSASAGHAAASGGQGPRGPQSCFACGSKKLRGAIVCGDCMRRTCGNCVRRCEACSGAFCKLCMTDGYAFGAVDEICFPCKKELEAGTRTMPVKAPGSSLGGIDALLASGQVRLGGGATVSRRTPGVPAAVAAAAAADDSGDVVLG
ncbi:unnamed protein product [Symbiodinium sp. KB8]|nr:unnamed protein product [Symbiodinium sp. KB8]